MSEARVPFGAALDAFGVPATVTVPGGPAVETRGIWVSPLEDAMPVGSASGRLVPRKVLALPLADVPSLPRGSTIVAIESGGDTPLTWLVTESTARDADSVRAIVVAG